MSRALLLFSIFIFCSPVWARPARCLDVFTELNLYQWSGLYKHYKSLKLVEFRNYNPGRWVLVEDGIWMRYQIFGESGPFRVHLEGLGGQLESSQKNKILKNHQRDGRTLVIELEGQGLTEVHERLAHYFSFLDGTRTIEYDRNVSNLERALKVIFETEGIQPKDIVAWSGHSFGGLTLAGLATMDPALFGNKPLFQFKASGVANFNHRLISSLQNTRIGLLSVFMNFFPNVDQLQIVNAIKSIEKMNDDPKTGEDFLRLESAAALTLGATDVDAVKFPASFPEGSRVQIFSAQNDKVIFAMLHWELAQASIEAGHPTTLALIEGVGHNFTSEMTTPQRWAMDRMSQRPGRYKGYYQITKLGRIKKLSKDEALPLFKASSWDTWVHQKAFLEALFKSLGTKAQYPDHWAE